ncbi:hypothetical protein JL721_9799 [Aureococcus anophagefferens]|nr:hypothetical protein JL721_9799 [Aureococcus anophagefferens]
MLEKRPMRHLIARLASVGFFVNFQPSEPFLTWYLLRRKGVSARALNAVVWPCDTYGALLFTLPVAACAERLTYAGAIAAHDAVYVAHAVACVPRRAAAAAAAYATAACKLGDALGSLAGQCMRGFGGRPLASGDALFYASWASTSLGVASLVWFSPRPAEPPEGDRWSAAAARAALRDPLGRAWSAWWVASVGVHAVAANYAQELLADASGGDRGALYGVLECAAGLRSCVGAALAPSAPRRPAARRGRRGRRRAGARRSSRHRRPSLLIANVVGRHVCFGFGFAAACAGIAAAAAPAAEADGAVVSPLRGDDDDDERPSDAPEPPRARCALIYGANTTLALAVAAALQWVLAARRAGAPAYFVAAAAIQAGFAALALCVFR